MTLLRFENPALAEVFGPAEQVEEDQAGTAGPFRRAGTVATGTATMTVAGTVRKTTGLLAVLTATAAVTWRVCELYPGAAWALAAAGAVAGMVVGIVVGLDADRAPTGAPVYALLEGVALGALSFGAEAEVPGVVVQATVATLAVLGALLLAYATGLLRATTGLTRFVVTATGAIAVLYALDLALAVVGVDVPLLHAGGATGAMVSLAVIGVVALNLVLDFAFVERAVEEGADRRLEWFGAFGLVVTLVWLYVEILLFILEHAGDGDGDFDFD